MQNKQSVTNKKHKKTEKNLDEYRKSQLPLPFIFPKPDRQYSNTIELYDAIPKYFWGRVSSKDRIGGRFLNILNREFEFRNKAFIVKITPARMISKCGIEKDYYPGKREELVEDSLRKIACDGQGLFLDDLAAATFSLNQLQKELKKMGHTYSISQIKDAIFICQKTNIMLESSDGVATLSFQIFETIGLRSWDEWKQTGKKTKCFVRFNALVTKSIKNGTFRQLNYKKCMSYKKNLSRWLHKRMSHLYIQASFKNSYSIRLSTIIRDSGMKRYDKLKDNLSEVRKALNEMIHKNALSGFREARRLSGRKIIDVKFTLIPGYILWQDAVRANKKAKQYRPEPQNYCFDSPSASYPQKSPISSH